MKRLFLSVFAMTMIFSISGKVRAGVYECSLDAAVFSDLNQCNSICSIGCSELDSKIENSGSCNGDNHRGFFYYKNKTYALTVKSVEFSAERNVKIVDEKHNQLIKNLLSTYGVKEAWIGLYDKLMSSQYNVVDPDRYIWIDGSRKEYTNFRANEPDNKLDEKAIGSADLYGEHWVTMSQDGLWQDIGNNSDGSKRLLPAVVEFTGNLACVSGVPKKDESPSKQLCKDGSTDCMMCAKELSATGVATFNKCEYGTVAPVTKQGIQVLPTSHDYLCGIDKMRCDAEQIPYETVKEATFYGVLPDPSKKDMIFNSAGNGVYVNNLSNGYVEIDVNFMSWAGIFNGWYRTDHKRVSISFRDKFPADQYISSTVEVLDYLNSHYDPVNACKNILLPDRSGCKLEGRWIGSKVNIIYRVKYRATDYDYSYKCPYSDKSCVKSLSDNLYYCSALQCADTGNDNNFVKDDTPPGRNDDNNNGNYDDNGSCMGTLSIFSGTESKCRPVGIQHEFSSCCRPISVEKAQSGDYDISGCTTAELKLMVDKNENRCINIGNYCAVTFLGSCVQRKDTYCCYDDDFQKSFAEAGKEMLKKSWGIPESAFCEGFTPEETQRLGAMGINDHPRMREYADRFGKQNADKLMDDFNKNFKDTVPTVVNGVINQTEVK